MRDYDFDYDNGGSGGGRNDATAPTDQFVQYGYSDVDMGVA